MVRDYAAKERRKEKETSREEKAAKRESARYRETSEVMEDSLDKFHEEIKGKSKRERVLKEQRKKVSRLSFGDEGDGMVHGAGIGIRNPASAVKDAAVTAAHWKTHEEEDENAAVEGAHRAEFVGESLARKSIYMRERLKGRREESRRLKESVLDEAQRSRLIFETAYGNEAKDAVKREAEKKKKSALQKLFQKKRYQKQYQAARQSKKVKDAAITSAQKFTEKAANALKIAAKAARRREHSYIGSEHLLLGLLEEQEGTAAQVLMGAGVEEEKLEGLIDQLIANGQVGGSMVFPTGGQGHGALAGLLRALGIGAVVCALWFRRRVSRPVEQITEVTRTIAGGRYGTELPVQRDDELGRLATAINELSQEISRSEKMQSEFISSISHELRTPLTAITGWSETLMFDAAIQGDSRRGIAIISKEAARLTSLVEELLEFTRIQDGRFNLSMELLDIESELEDTIFTYQELLRQDGMQLIYNPPEEEIPLVPGDPERLKQVFLNILDNAAKYARDGKTIEVSVFSDSEAATIQFRDHGPGIPENELPHVKEKFFKGEKHKARGSGIGLAVCDEIITRSGGTLTIANAPGGGTLVSVRLPFAPESGN